LHYCTTALNSKISPNPSLPKGEIREWLYQRGEIKGGFAKWGKREGLCQRGE